MLIVKASKMNVGDAEILRGISNAWVQHVYNSFKRHRPFCTGLSSGNQGGVLPLQPNPGSVGGAVLEPKLVVPLGPYIGLAYLSWRYAAWGFTMWSLTVCMHRSVAHAYLHRAGLRGIITNITGFIFQNTASTGSGFWSRVSCWSWAFENAHSNVCMYVCMYVYWEWGYQHTPTGGLFLFSFVRALGRAEDQWMDVRSRFRETCVRPISLFLFLARELFPFLFWADFPDLVDSANFLWLIYEFFMNWRDIQWFLHELWVGPVILSEFLASAWWILVSSFLFWLNS